MDEDILEYDLLSQMHEDEIAIMEQKEEYIEEISSYLENMATLKEKASEILEKFSLISEDDLDDIIKETLTL